ncbi:MAG: response regulator, partial [Flammeovirgaceae bacterium]|nr:response regulator [Flammeovirgaceae bacterium]
TDFEMPGISGTELVRIARTVQPEIKIIVLSMHQDPSVVKELLRNGVNAYVLKKDTHLSLIEAHTKLSITSAS